MLPPFQSQYFSTLLFDNTISSHFPFWSKPCAANSHDIWMKRSRSHGEKDPGRTPTPKPESRITCSLPPCHLEPRHFNSYTTYQQHMTTVHDFVCDECHRRFPLLRIMEIHIDECHNPIVALQAERPGSTIYQCFECQDRFETPTLRNQHMVQSHQYSPQFKFDVVTKGV